MLHCSSAWFPPGDGGYSLCAGSVLEGILRLAPNDKPTVTLSERVSPSESKGPPMQGMAIWAGKEYLPSGDSSTHSSDSLAQNDRFFGSPCQSIGGWRSGRDARSHHRRQSKRVSGARVPPAGSRPGVVDPWITSASGVPLIGGFARRTRSTEVRWRRRCCPSTSP